MAKKMRKQQEINKAIAKLKSDLKIAPEYSLFGDDNHACINAMIHVLENKWDTSDVYNNEGEMGWDNDESIAACDACAFLAEELEITDITWNGDGYLPEVNVCAKQCKECPFAKTSPKGWLAEYTTDDFIQYLNAEVSFPCHMQMPDDDLSPEDCHKAIEEGKMKLCRGYVECVIKSAKLPYRNQLLMDAIAKVKTEGLSENSMNIFEFINHHKKD